MEAIGTVTINGVSIPATLPGSIFQPDSTAPHLLSAQISIDFAGEFVVTVVETGDAVPSHLLGSPFTIVVDTAATNTASCKSISPSSVVAGDDFNIIIQTFDEYENPTDYGRLDQFLVWVEGETATKLRRVLNP